MLRRACISGLLFVLFSISLSTVAISQTTLLLDSQPQLVLSGDEQFQDFIIPKNDSLNQLILEAKGADGGWIEYTYKDRFNAIRTQRVQAGEGATVSAVYSIGTGLGEIPPLSTLRMLVGKRGEWSKHDLLTPGQYGGGGGGGTAILISKDRGTSWQILMVAGGGGGAGVQFMNGQLTNRPGIPASDEEYGSAGDTQNPTATPGKRGYGGGSVNMSGGGGGAYSDGEHLSGVLYYGNAGWKDAKLASEPLGGLGGIQEKTRKGGWGFGGGGSGDLGGGGGGGYSGGGAAQPGNGGGGGGSYLNQIAFRPMTSSKQQNDYTKNPGDGYIRYMLMKKNQNR
ncbi:MAG: hypothetical protein H6576_18300 [Lewinellaceae bacterium]|nr:hypothetical protein [Saprospiraceae bacterium]MCB9345644.1 hypothetical protein [Lewinellaceae bacterium]